MIGDFPHLPAWDSPVLEGYRPRLLVEGAVLRDIAPGLANRLAYLATPYSRVVVDERGRWDLGLNAVAIETATRWARRCALAGITAVAPITLAGDMIQHDYASIGGPRMDPFDDAFWEAWCRPLLARCDCVIVPPVEGWRDSRGVWREAVATLSVLRPVYLLEDAP